jgi:hypothetical protein
MSSRLRGCSSLYSLGQCFKNCGALPPAGGPCWFCGGVVVFVWGEYIFGTKYGRNFGRHFAGLNYLPELDSNCKQQIIISIIIIIIIVIM